MKEYVFHVVTNDVNPDYTEYDEHAYYRCNADNQNDAYNQVEQDIPDLVFYEVIKINY